MITSRACGLFIQTHTMQDKTTRIVRLRKKLKKIIMLFVLSCFFYSCKTSKSKRRSIKKRKIPNIRIFNNSSSTDKARHRKHFAGAFLIQICVIRSMIVISVIFIPLFFILFNFFFKVRLKCLVVLIICDVCGIVKIVCSLI